jgi:poly-gamma-glutamate synthesis protein (capsule biosynthesis protein)
VLGYRITAVAALALSCANTGGDAVERAPGRASGAAPGPNAPSAPAAAVADASAAPARIAADAAPAEQALPAPTGPQRPIEITFVGDVMFGRYVEGGRATIPKGDYNLFERVTDLVRADIAIANLETPVVRKVPPRSPYGLRLRFAASPDEVEHLVRGGFTAVTLANNHSYDLRLKGLLATPKMVRDLGLTPLGVAHAEPPVFRVDTIEKDGWRVGFVGITTERNGPQRPGQPELPYVKSAKQIPGVLVPVIKEARADHDILVVLAHWGKEYMDKPWKSQLAAGRALIDAGADLVIGHHPHVLQAFERRDRGLIAYSLGNFRFDYTRKIPGLTGVLRARFRPEGRCLERVVFHPAHTERARIKGKSVYRPAPATGKKGDRVRARVVKKSAEVGTTWEREGDDLVLAFPDCASR